MLKIFYEIFVDIYPLDNVKLNSIIIMIAIFNKLLRYEKEIVSMDCIFCKIAEKEIPTSLLYEDDAMVIFKDLNPIAPIHLLAIPKQHIASTSNISPENSNLIAHIFEVIAKKSNELGLEKGYRIINNCGDFGGQTVNHIHFHILGGKNLNWNAL